MKKQKLRILMLILLLALASAAVVYAQTIDGYDIFWRTVDGGSGTASGNSYTLMGTIGQPEPGPNLTGGVMVPDVVLLNIREKSS